MHYKCCDVYTPETYHARWDTALRIHLTVFRSLRLVPLTVSFRVAPCHSFDCHSHVVAYADSLQRWRRCHHFQRHWLNLKCHSWDCSQLMGWHWSSGDFLQPFANSAAVAAVVHSVCVGNSWERLVQYLVMLRQSVYNFRCSHLTYRLSNWDCS